MLTLARTPLSLVTNTHYAMSDDRRKTRRSSARLTEKENALPVANGLEEDGTASTTTATRGKGKGKGAASGRGSKRKQDYDEEDDGFMFTRTKPKRTKTAQVPPPVVEEREEEVRQAQLVKKRPRARSDEEQNATGHEAAQNQHKDMPTRRNNVKSARVDLDENEPAPLEIKKKRRSKAKSPEPDVALGDDATRARGRSRRSVADARATPEATHAVSTKIALPFADTPIIRRNQEMRRGKDGPRRSSLGNRGRRASSLIDSGRTALPHEHVETNEYFKHIESGLPEPRRMRQLLTWCATRALGDKGKTGADVSGKDAHVRAAAREIQQQILKDLGVRSEMSDWFGREDTQVVRDNGPVAKRPNPKNVTNEAKIRQLEEQLQRLQSERATWERLLRPSNKQALLPAGPTKLQDAATMASGELHASNLAIIERLKNLELPAAPRLQQETRTKLDATTKDLEFQTDTLANNVHVLGQYRQAAEKVATQVLDDAATALEVRSRKEREKSGTEEVGVRDVLRGLSRVERRE